MATRKTGIKARKPMKRVVAPPRLTLDSIEIRDWDVLGAPVRMSFSPRRTVLVGKNGAGKSLLLERLSGASDQLLSPIPQPGPSFFRCSFVDAKGQPLHYRYKAEEKENVLNQWEERCWRASSHQPLWSASKGQVQFAGGKGVLMYPKASLLSIASPDLPAVPQEALAIRSFFQGSRWVWAGISRGLTVREPVLLALSTDPSVAKTPPRQSLRSLARLLLDWNESAPKRLHEFIQLGRKLELWRDVGFHRYVRSNARTEVHDGDGFISITFDGVNIGHLPDGTLRVIAMLLALLSTSPGCMLFLEEPEMGIHPGLLYRLLSTFDSYVLDRQLVVSTHSHQVVNWAGPEEIRLVERRGGITHVSPLSDAQVQRLKPYLEETGTLGDFVYGGGADA